MACMVLSMGPSPKRAAISLIADSVTSASRPASRFSISLRRGVPWQKPVATSTARGARGGKLHDVGYDFRKASFHEGGAYGYDIVIAMGRAGEEIGWIVRKGGGNRRPPQCAGQWAEFDTVPDVEEKFSCRT